MTVKGFTCPHGPEVPFVDCLAHASTNPSNCPWPYPVVAGMIQGLQHDVGDTISATMMLNCQRKVMLEQQQDVYLDPNTLFYAFRGQMFHAIAEAAKPVGAIAEQRFSRKIGEIEISGQPDLIWPDHRLLLDFKSTKSVPSKVYYHHALQCNIYRWLVAPVYQIDDLRVVYMDMTGTITLPVPIMDNALVLHTITDRATILHNALHGGPLPNRVDQAGRWQCNWCTFTQQCWGEQK